MTDGLPSEGSQDSPGCGCAHHGPAADFRTVLGRCPTGVALITAPAPWPGADPLGMVVGTFTSVSLDPPLVGFLPARTSTTWPLIRSAGRFCVNVLSAGQRGVCEAFVAKSPSRWDLPHHRSPSGCPLLPDAVAWVDCVPHTQSDAGDHWFVTGSVRALGTGHQGPPLVFLGGHYGTYAPRPRLSATF
ncbi:flavin reductase family protein [Streptomyces kanamyceticus]|uniref:Flavin reductase n=1 Tax=Streptomyces kanamyceticus TaxID=1967 RepID=A0A5J6GQZ9_STRKN|nr:flavin reductase family protein [Streptomyces kanamyceticus]QEU96832.1 flavin reductase [Streptomyces kanamyceticus]